MSQSTPDSIPAGRVAIVTGAGQPHGAAVARALAAAGARVALTDLNPDRIARLAAELRAAGHEALDIPADIASKFQCVNVIETTRAEWQRLDILVNAGFIEPQATVMKMDEWEWQRTLDVNLKAVFFMCQLCGRVMADSGQGVIVNLADTRAPAAGRAAFAASQAAVVAFTAVCAAEYAPSGVRVSLVGLNENANSLAQIAVARACEVFG